MVHCILLTDKFHTQKDPVYIMEDQFGNIFGEQMVEGVTVGWHDLSPDVFIETAEKLRCCFSNGGGETSEAVAVVVCDTSSVEA